MMLTQQEVALYLLQRRLASSQSVIEGDLQIIEASRRNDNFRVISEQGPCYFVKKGFDQERREHLAHEALVYRLFQSEDTPSSISRYLPSFHEYDSEKSILVLELLQGAQTFVQYHFNRGRFPVSLAIEFGRALATLHREFSAKLVADVGYSWFARQPSWILSIHEPGAGALREISNGNLQLVKIIQKFPDFSEHLSRLRQNWKADTLIHGDIKWDNCLIERSSDAQRKVKIKIVDWEAASIGDSCWDVGSVFSDYLSFWLLSIPIAGGHPPDRFLHLARFPLAKMQPAMRAFWRAYMSQMSLDHTVAYQWLVRAVEYCAAKLILTAFGYGQTTNNLTGNAAYALQLSLNMLRRPHEAATRLLGIALPPAHWDAGTPEP